MNFGGLFGEAPVMTVSGAGNDAFMERGGRIPAPLQGLTELAGAPLHGAQALRSSIIRRMRWAVSCMPSALQIFSASVSCSTASMV